MVSHYHIFNFYVKNVFRMLFCIMCVNNLIKAMTKLTKVIVFGGSGRVGGSTVRSLNDRFVLDIVVAGRSQYKWEQYLKRINRDLKSVSKFVSVDINNPSIELDNLISNSDLVIHTAGPFQGQRINHVFESALRQGKDYIDVCDDIYLSRILRNEHFKSISSKSGSRAIVSAGIWPGCSSLLACDVIEAAGGNEAVEEVEFSFFTAGSGGAGQTILTATFLLLGEDVLVYENGKEVYKKSATDTTIRDFGKGIGEREVVRLNLIECESCHVTSQVPNVSTYFGTAPKFWNFLFKVMAQVIPQALLKDKTFTTNLALISLPMVRLIDAFVGSRNAIRIQVTNKQKETFTGILSHEDLEKVVGDSIASFAHQLMMKPGEEMSIAPGVYFPEEVSDVRLRKNILNDIGSDAITYSITKNEEA